jgi:hypothetical protein
LDLSGDSNGLQEEKMVLNRFELKTLSDCGQFRNKMVRGEADLWAELGDKYHSAWESLLKGISKGHLRSAVRHRSAEGLFALLKGEFSRMRGDVARCEERTS